MDSRIRGNDRLRDSHAPKAPLRTPPRIEKKCLGVLKRNTREDDKLQDGSAFFVVPALFVVPAQAGTHTSNQGWIPAYAESTPRIEKKYSGGE